jgi:hypothetical protein
MHAATKPPATVTPEAAARVAELGMEQALERMLEHARTVIPDLVRLEVILEPAYDTGDVPYLIIQAIIARSLGWNDRPRDAWASWKAAMFPPQLGEHIALSLLPGADGPEASVIPPSFTTPVTLTPDARARLDELGMVAEFRQMLEHTEQTVPGLLGIQVEAYDRLDGTPPALAVTAVSDNPDLIAGPERFALSGWLAQTFPPEVIEHFSLQVSPGNSHAG